ncbi:TIGR03758 family integrating conjugative element protein, partial [Stenotrophomonas maltophilia]
MRTAYVGWSESRLNQRQFLGVSPSAMATVLVGVVFAVLLVWGVWAMRTAYVGWSESRLNQRQFLGV